MTTTIKMWLATAVAAIAAATTVAPATPADAAPVRESARPFGCC